MELVSSVLCQKIDTVQKRGFNFIGVGMDKAAFPSSTKFPVNMAVSFWTYWRRLPFEQEIHEFNYEMSCDETGIKKHLAQAVAHFKDGAISTMVLSFNVKISIDSQGTYRFFVSFDKRSFEIWDIRFFLS